MDLGHHVLAVDEDGFVFGRAQGDVQDGAIFGDVDFVAAEHGVDAFAKAGFLGELQEEREGFVGDAVLGVIEVDAERFEGEFFRAFGIVSKKLSEVHGLHGFIVGSQCGPGFALGEWCYLRRRFAVGFAFRAMIVLLTTFRGFTTGGFVRCRGLVLMVIPEAKPPDKRIGVVSQTAVRRKLFQLLGIAAAQNDVIRFEGGDMRSTTSATWRRHFFLPRCSNPRKPTNPRTLLFCKGDGPVP